MQGGYSYEDVFAPTIVKQKYEIDENNRLIKFKGVTGVIDGMNVAKSVTANAAKAALAVGTGRLSLLAKKGRSFGKGKIDGGSLILRLDEITGYDLLEHTGSRTDSKKSINGVGAATSIVGSGVGVAHVGSSGISDSTAVIEDISAQINTDNLENPVLQISFFPG